MIIKLSLPNDYESECDQAAALVDAGGDLELIYDPISNAARDAGLRYVRETDYGALWEGTEEQIAACTRLLPAWARPYASVVTEVN